MTIEQRNLLNDFYIADKKVTEIEKKGGSFIDGYKVETTKEYDKALEYAQSLYFELEKQGINPF